jgi:hypothetical protein
LSTTPDALGSGKGSDGIVVLGVLLCVVLVLVVVVGEVLYVVVVVLGVVGLNTIELELLSIRVKKL